MHSDQPHGAAMVSSSNREWMCNVDLIGECFCGVARPPLEALLLFVGFSY